MFLSFSKFRTVYIGGIEISRQLWNRISPFFLNNLVCRWNSNSEVALKRPTVGFVHVEVSLHTCPSNHCSVQQLVQRCRFARPEIFAQTHGAFGVDSQLRSFRRRRTNTRSLLHSQLLLQVVLIHKVEEYYGQQSFRVLLVTWTHLSALQKWTA